MMSCTGLGPRSTVLHKIARKGNEHDLLKLLKQGADVTARDAEGRTPLHLAVMRGHLGIIKRLLEYGGPVVLLSRDILNCTPVHLAAVQNQVQLISMLIAALLEDTSGCTPLHEVARRGCMQDFLGFLHLGWDIAACDGRNRDVLQLTEDSKSGFSTVKQILGWSALHLAAMEGKLSNIEKLIKRYSFDVHCQSANTWTPLHYAAAYNQVGSIEALVRLGAKVDVRDSVGSTPLHVACGEGHLQAVQKLIELGADPAAKDRDGCTPLYCASAWNRIEVVKSLRQLGCPSWVQSEEGRTAVHIASEQGWVELIRVLVRELECRVDSKDTYKFTPLHSAANWGWVDAISALVGLNHPVNVRDYLGRTPLHYAALHGRTNAIERLIELGATLRERDTRGGCTALHLAADAGQCEAVATLIAMGADTEMKTLNGLTSLQLAATKGPGNVDVIGRLVELGASSRPATDDKSVESPLHIAARAGREDIVQKLIDYGASATAQTKDGSTPLHYAAAFGQAHVIEPLVNAGCSVHSRDQAMNTPLHLAAGCGFLDAVRKLVEMGADLNARDMSDCTPLQNAAHGTYSALAPMPSGVSGTCNGNIQGLGSLSLRRHGLPSAVLQKGCEDEAHSSGGMVPVRTGFAWATLEGSEAVSSMYLNGLDATYSPSSNRTCNTWKGAELMSLLRKATRGRRPSSLFVNPDAGMDSQKTEDKNRQLHRQRSDDESDWDKWSHRDFEREREGLELLLKKTEALQMSQMEQDRTRLLPVVERLVDMGADISARDNEGRTALHLAAGCGDKLMVLKLEELGADVNSRDNVGGTAMHHAAMANKKEMMFTLALLGCDWRAKADGIDGASPAFVLCGQHGKTRRQQKLLEAKLRKVYIGGEAERRSVKGSTENANDQTARQQEGFEQKRERADANMEALLKEVEAEAAAAKNKRASSVRKRNKKRLETHDAACIHPLKSISTALPAKPDDMKQSRDECTDDSARNRAKEMLQEAVTCSNFMLEIGSVAGREAMIDVREKMDQAIANAHKENVGAKYAKKMRKRLQALIDSLPADEGNRNESSGYTGHSAFSSSVRSEIDDDEGWVTAQSNGKRKQSSSRNCLPHGGDISRKQVVKPSTTNKHSTVRRSQNASSKNTATLSMAKEMAAVNAATQPYERRIEEQQRVMFSSTPTPSEKRMAASRIATERERTATVRSSGSDISQGKSSRSSAWDSQSQGTVANGNISPLSDPDFPPLQSTVKSGLLLPVLKRTGNRRETMMATATTTTTTTSHESGSSCSKSEETETLKKGKSKSPTSESPQTTSTGTTDTMTDQYPQYELFGPSASPALPTAVSVRSGCEINYSTTNGVERLGSCAVTIETKEVDSVDGADHGFECMGTTAPVSYPEPIRTLSMPILLTNGNYTSLNSYSHTTAAPVGPRLHPCVSGQTPASYAAYTTSYSPYSSCTSYYYEDNAAHSPIQSVAMQVALQCLNAEEIADKLPKKIPGLAESDSDESIGPSFNGTSYIHYPLKHTSSGDGPGVSPRHLLGELASELET